MLICVGLHKTVRALLQLGADPNLARKDGHTALSLAAEKVTPNTSYRSISTFRVAFGLIPVTGTLGDRCGAG
jgi:hypothetical protein